MYDGILRMQTQEGVKLVGYADDVAVVATDKNWEVAKTKLHDTTERILAWLGENSLEMAPEKTEIVALKYGRRKREGVIEVAGKEIEISQSVNYLGVRLDTSVSFGPHIRATAAKALKAVSSLGKLMPNFGGPGETKRRILGGVASSIMLYGAPIWADSLNVATYRKLFQGVQRKMALRVCRGYRMVSYDAAVVVASLVPIHLLAKERKRLWVQHLRDNPSKRQEREATIREWQSEWDASSNGRWTRRLIQDVAAWTERRHGTVDYYLTQWLTNHGSFKTYLKRIGKSQCDRCSHCGEEEDTAEHVLTGCRRWTREWTQLNNTLRVVLTADNIIAVVLRSEKNWIHVTKLINTIMSTKEQEGR